MVDIRNTLRELGEKLRAYMSDALFKLKSWFYSAKGCAAVLPMA